MSDKDKVWVVEEQQENSWGEGWTEDYSVVSIHYTKDGAEKAAELLRSEKAVIALTYGEIEDSKANIDDILGAIEDENVKEALRQEVAKPKADLMKAIFKVIEDHGVEVANITVNWRPIKE
jgi:hypothetical protein